MAATFTPKVRDHVVERFQPGSRTNQFLLGGIAVGTIIAFGITYATSRDPALAGACLPGAVILLFAVVMRLRSVTFFLHPETRRIRREARWCGVPLSAVTLDADNFDSIRVGSFTGHQETFPVYWAQLVGTKTYTLVESGSRKEVWAVADEVGEILGLSVALGRIG